MSQIWWFSSKFTLHIQDTNLDGVLVPTFFENLSFITNELEGICDVEGVDNIFCQFRRWVPRSSQRSKDHEAAELRSAWTGLETRPHSL